MKTKENPGKKIRGISPVISTLIISGTLLIILVIASFVATNLLELQVASTEFEQAKANMLLLDEVIQGVALRQGSGSYVQFNQRSGGIGIAETPLSVKITAPDVQDSSCILKPNADGTYRQWDVVNGTSHWSVVSDGNDNTYIKTSKRNLIDIQNLEDPPFDDAATIYSLNIFVRARTSDPGNINIAIHERLGASTRERIVQISRQWANYSIGPLRNAPDGFNWTRQKIVDLQVGVRSTDTKECQVSEIWVIVNYKPLKEIYQSSNLTSIYYRAGSRASGAEMTLRGNDSLCVNTTGALGFLRVEHDNGLKIKLDYFRVRIMTNTTLRIGDVWYNITEITFIKITKGPTGGSDIVNVKVHNLGVNTYTRLYDTNYVNVRVEVGGKNGSLTLASPSGWRTAIIFTEVWIQISTT